VYTVSILIFLPLGFSFVLNKLDGFFPLTLGSPKVIHVFKDSVLPQINRAFPLQTPVG
jgi:hypothetical protein